MSKKTASPYETPLVIVCFFLLLYLLAEKIWMVYAGFAIGMLSLLLPAFTRLLNQGWRLLNRILGIINTHLLLSLVFFLLLTPLALLYRLFKKQASAGRSGASFFRNRDHLYGPEDLENPW